MSVEQKTKLQQGYKVEVDDNFHFMDEDERWCLGEFATYEEALAAAKALVEASMSSDPRGKTAEEIYDSYVSFGDDPFIIPFGGTPAPTERFSAWNYAKECAERLRAAWDYAQKCADRFTAPQFCLMPSETAKNS